MDSRLIQIIQATGEIYGKTMTPVAAELFLSDLGEFPDAAVAAALTKCRKELKFFPTVSDVVARIDDGRVGPEEAWAMIPKDESGSVVWSDEMAEAYNVVRFMIEDDPIAARVAFKETYTRLVADARSNRKPVKWSPSLGHDPHSRASALMDAVNKRRMALEDARTHAPELEYQGTPNLKQLGFSGLMKQLNAPAEGGC